jgi:hypothetical protein
MEVLMRSTATQRVNEIADLAKELPESALEELFDFAQFLKIKKQEFSYKGVADSAEYMRSLRLREGKKIKSGQIFIQELIEWQKSSS